MSEVPEIEMQLQTVKVHLTSCSTGPTWLLHEDNI